MGSFESTLREEYAIISDDSNRVPIQVTETSNQSISIVLFELVEATAVEDSRQNCVHIEGLLMIDRDNAVEIFFRIERLFWLLEVLSVFSERVIRVDVFHNSTGKLNSVVFIMCQVISHSRLMSMEMGTS